jgi:mannose-6-phosphate isomerase-like protein (cupin superfamily)
MQQSLSAKSDMSLEEYQNLPNISIDYAVMEKTKKGAVLPSDFGWSDIGSWKSLYDFLPKDSNGNVIDGAVVVQKTQNCFIFGYERLIAVNRLKDMVIVETPDAVFVSDIDNSRDVKNIVDTIKEKGRDEHHHHRTVHHPWGSATLLEKKESYQVSRLVVYPGSHLETSGIVNLSVVKGAATLAGGKLLQKGMSLTISETQLIRNEGADPLYLIEVRVK